MSEKKEKRPKWVEPYLAELSETNTPITICKQLGIHYQSVCSYRKNHEWFAEEERMAKLAYQESVYKEVYEQCKAYPNLMLKFAERVVEELKPPNQQTTINIDNSQCKTVLGLTQEECYEETQRLLQNFKSKQKQITNVDASKSLIESQPVDNRS